MRFKLNRRKTIVICCLIVGVWQCSYGSYLYAKATVAQYLILSAWKESVEDKKTIRPWSWADTWPVARLIVPKYQEDMIVLSGDSGHALAFGPGYRLGSALPGERGNTMISAHRDTHFQFLQHVKRNDIIQIETLNGETFSYVVTGMSVVDQSTPVYSDDAKFQLTLVTCFPFNTLAVGGRLRYVVTAERDKEDIPYT